MTLVSFGSCILMTSFPSDAPNYGVWIHDLPIASMSVSVRSRASGLGVRSAGPRFRCRRERRVNPRRWCPELLIAPPVTPTPSCAPEAPCFLLRRKKPPTRAPSRPRRAFGCKHTAVFPPNCLGCPSTPAIVSSASDCVLWGGGKPVLTSAASCATIRNCTSAPSRRCRK